MNTILTDDERRAAANAAGPFVADQNLAVELAVLAKLREQEPVAMRYGFDGYGYRYIDSGSGSDWRTRIPDAEEVYAAPLPAVAQVPQGRRTAFGMTHVEHLNEVVKWLDSRRERLHHEGCSVHEPSARCNCGLHKALTNIRAVVNELVAAPEAPAQSINPADVRVDVVMKSMGGFAPASTHGVKLTHMPTGIEVTATEKRSQHANREAAWQELARRVNEAPAQTIPAPWREAVKVAREALAEEKRVRLLGQEPDVHWESMRDVRRACYAATDAALAQLDALEGGE